MAAGRACAVVKLVAVLAWNKCARANAKEREWQPMQLFCLFISGQKNICKMEEEGTRGQSAR